MNGWIINGLVMGNEWVSELMDGWMDGLIWI